MSTPMLIWDFGSAIRSDYDPDGFLTVQIDWYGEDSHAEPATLHHPLGFISRPVAGAANDTQTCQLLRFDTDNDKHALALSDPRHVPELPDLEEGASCQYASTKGHYVLVDSSGIKAYVGLGKKVKLGGDGARPAAHSDETVQALQQILIQLAALNAWLGATIVSFGGVFTDPGAGATSTLVTATTAAISAITPLLTTLPAQKVDVE